MSQKEMQSMLQFMIPLMEGVPHALDTPDEYKTVITEKSQGKYDVTVSNNSSDAGLAESYKLHFKDLGDTWVVSNPQ
jgi:hypothetical protein